MKRNEGLFVERILGLYLELPQTPSRASRYDRRLANQLCQQRISLEIVEAAFLLASARRLFRDPSLPPLGPIRSLHYFLPVIEELGANNVSPEYVKYLRGKLASLSVGG